MSEVVRQQLRDHMSVLAPVFRPRHTFGEYVQGGTREGSRSSDKGLQDLQAVFATVAGAKPFALEHKELNPPLTFDSSSLEFTEFEYRREAGGKQVLIVCPLKWVISYTNYPPKRLRELLADKNRNNSELRQYLLQYAGLSVVIARQPGLVQLLEALHLHIGSERIGEFGELPVPCIRSEVRTMAPPDSVVVESTELSGRDVFEEVVDLESVAALRDPLREKLMALTSATPA